MGGSHIAMPNRGMPTDSSVQSRNVGAPTRIIHMPLMRQGQFPGMQFPGMSNAESPFGYQSQNPMMGEDQSCDQEQGSPFQGFSPLSRQADMQTDGSNAPQSDNQDADSNDVRSNDADQQGDFSQQVATEVIKLTNEQRSQHGLPALSEDTQLDSLAGGRSSDMLQNNYFSHTSKNGQSPSDVLHGAGYQYRGMGENIHMMVGYGTDVQQTAQKIVNDWMNSPEHRENILNSSFTTIGVGVASQGSSVYTTAEYTLPM